MGLRTVLDELRWLTEDVPPVLQNLSDTDLTAPLGSCKHTHSPAFQFWRAWLEEEMEFKPVNWKGMIALVSSSKYVAVVPTKSGSSGSELVSIRRPPVGSEWADAKVQEKAEKLAMEVYETAEKLQLASESLKQVAVRVFSKYRAALTKYLEDELKLETHVFEFAGLKSGDKDDIFVVDKTNIATLKTLMDSQKMSIPYNHDPMNFMGAKGEVDVLSSWGHVD